MDNVFIVAANEAAGERPAISRDAVCDLETTLPLISHGPLKEDLKRLYPYGTCYVRGIREGTDNHLATWDAMAAGDLVLGCRDRSIVWATFVFAKTNDPALAAHLLGADPEGPFGLMCFTDKPYWEKFDQSARWIDISTGNTGYRSGRMQVRSEHPERLRSLETSSTLPPVHFPFVSAFVAGERSDEDSVMRRPVHENPESF
jgi:hypothetical protein